ncbi:hypothetical protein BDN67DRAFT_197734 [Paxillus ammoniavirescens]|nr:hypothetical protein BDN67DRAFT_197734 [Paxillus ammoniavirescens]
MFARLTLFILALLAIANTASACQTVCCMGVSFAPIANQGYTATGCTAIQQLTPCAQTKLCCNTIKNKDASQCTWIS